MHSGQIMPGSTPDSLPPQGAYGYGAGGPTTAALSQGAQIMPGSTPDSLPPQGAMGGMNPWEKGGIAAAGGVGLLGLSSLFGGGDEESSGPGAESYLSQIPDILKKYFQPYQQMVQDPTGQLKMLGQGFQQSPGYQFQLGQAEKAGGQAAAAGGMAGSPMQQQQAQQTATGFANQDYYNYLNKAMNMYQTGAQGYRGLGEDLSSNLMSQAQLQQLQQEEAAKQKEQEHSDMWGTIGSIAGAGAQMLPMFF